jgi:hypothetical protein
MADETFAMAGSSIHVQPEELRRQAKGIKRKTPRWQPRGDDTQSFRPLVQEEEVSCGESTRPDFACQLFSGLAGSAFG